MQGTPTHPSSASTDSSARFHFHVALAGVVLAFLAPVVSWSMALLHRSDPSGPWKRRLFTLAIVDTFLVVAFAVAAARGVDLGTGPDHAAVTTSAETEPRPLFAPAPEEELKVVPSDRTLAAASEGIDVALMIALFIAGRRRGVRSFAPAAVVLGLFATSLAGSIALASFRLTIGVSPGAFLVALLAGSLALLVVAAATRPGVERAFGKPGDMSTRSAVAYGTFYGLAGAVRIGVFLALAAATLHVPLRGAAEAFGFDFRGHPFGAALFVFTAVVIAPIGEETLFRGVLLPWLTGFMRPGWALFWSAVAFAAGHTYYGAGALLLFYYGLILGWARLRTGNLRASIILHALVNAAAAVTLALRS